MEEKLHSPVRPLGSVAGLVNKKGSEISGLAEGTPVCVSVVDAHAAMPATGITALGKMLMIILAQAKILYLKL